MKEHARTIGAFAGARRRYALAVASVVLAVCIRLALRPVLGPERFPLPTLLTAIVFSAAYCGLGPSILALVFAVFAAFYFFTTPVFSFRLENSAREIGGLVLFVLNCGLIIWLGEARRRALVDAQQMVREGTEELSSLTARLLQVQDEERRRMACALHDSVGQLHAAMSMNLGALHSMNLPAPGMAKVEDTRSLLEEASDQIRTMSHLLYPPLLEEVGLVSALKCFVEGFCARSNIQVNLDATDDIGRYDPPVEIAIFRVVQECLTNIHRHSESRTACVKLDLGPKGLEVTVRDYGKGIPPEKLDNANARVGVGLSGMKQRVVQLGGTLEIRAANPGVIVNANVPVEAVSRHAGS